MRSVYVDAGAQRVLLKEAEALFRGIAIFSGVLGLSRKVSPQAKGTSLFITIWVAFPMVSSQSRYFVFAGQRLEARRARTLHRLAG